MIEHAHRSERIPSARSARLFHCGMYPAGVVCPGILYLKFSRRSPSRSRKVWYRIARSPSSSRRMVLSRVMTLAWIPVLQEASEEGFHRSTRRFRPFGFLSGRALQVNVTRSVIHSRSSMFSSIRKHGRAP